MKNYRHELKTAKPQHTRDFCKKKKRRKYENSSNNVTI